MTYILSNLHLSYCKMKYHIRFDYGNVAISVNLFEETPRKTIPHDGCNNRAYAKGHTVLHKY